MFRHPLKQIETRASKQVGANFQPSIVNEAYHNVLEQVVTALCYSTGFDDIEEGALETLLLVFHTQIRRMGEQAKLACEVAGRTLVNPGDAWFGLINLGVDVQNLPNYFYETIERGGITIHAPQIMVMEDRIQPSHIGVPRPHPSYVYEWMPRLPDPYTYIETDVTNEPDITYEKVREAMSQKSRNGIMSLVNHMIRTYPSYCLFPSFKRIIEDQVQKTIEKESNEKRYEEAFISFRDFLGTTDIEYSENIAKKLEEKGLISKNELESGVELACMCSDGTIIDTNGQILKLDEHANIDLKDRGQLKTRINCLEAGAESLRYTWNMDEMLDELIEIDSIAFDIPHSSKSNMNIDEMKLIQDKWSFDYIPEWAHVLKPSYEHRAYLQTLSPDKMEEEVRQEEKKPKTEESEGADEENKSRKNPVKMETVKDEPDEDDEIQIIEVPSKIKREIPEIMPRKPITSNDINRFLKAAKEGDVREVKRFLKLGIYVDVTDNFGWNAAMCAAAEGQYEVCKLLYYKGSDPDIVESRGKTFTQIAEESGHRELVDRLIHHFWRRPNIQKNVDEMSFCEICDEFLPTNEVSRHLTLITHQLNDKNRKGAAPQSGIMLGPNNIGYRLMQASGWTEEKGLGKNSDGHRFPIRTTLKRDRCGLGISTSRPRITHFGPYDKNAVRSMNEYGCNVCNEEYSAHVESRFPRVLTGCGHTICQGCASLIAEAGRPSIFCPFDRISTTIPGGDIKNLKKNFALLELLEKIADGTLFERSVLDEEHDRYAKEKKLNVKCDEEPNHIAVLYCTVCDSNLCERCSDVTHSTNVLSKHKRVPLGEKPPMSVHCKLHSSYVVEFVCKEDSCDNESPLMCLMCRDYGRHKGHKHVLVEKEAEELREKMREYLEELTQKAEIVNGTLSVLETKITDLSPDQFDGPLSETRREVRAHFRKLREVIDEDENKAIDKLENYARERVESMTMHKERLKQVSDLIGNTCAELQKSLIMERGKLLDRKDDLLALAESTSSEPTNIPDASQLNTRIAFSISHDRRLHIGEFIDSRIVLLGLDGAGKTSIVRRLKKVRFDSVMAPHPTIGFNVEMIHFKNYRLNLWDVGGLPKLRHLWKHYYSNAQAILYVIDGHCPERFPEATKELMKVIGDPLVGTTPVFVAINRKEETPINGNLDALLSQLSSLQFQLQLHQCDAASGSGISQIIDQITTSLSRLNGDCPV
ncbi:unnamed protein product [Caenorhabditis bovis]|uniref:Transcription initiation factor TFIID subunit 8 n=1 Tax=Caenorhabditis bovis TaxID=2654633 RepID=A0A8S1ETU7_9PELO|nr:unnamed protein product [Caenorhabditis bovis]